MKPPAVARAIVRLFSRSEDRSFLLEDLSNRFQELARTEGCGAAKQWYWSQALSIVPWAMVPDIDLIRRQSWAGVLGDLRLGLRTLARRPLYAVGVAGTLGLGLAAATITFAVAWKVWLAPLPIPDPDRVVRLYEIEPPDLAVGTPEVLAEARRHQFSDALAADFKAHSWRTLGAVSVVVRGGSQSDWTLDGETYSLSSLTLRREAFEILGIVPTLGRLPTVTEHEVLLSERFWRAAFGSDPDVVGSRFTAGSAWSTLIVGVARLPSGYPGDADFVSVSDWAVQWPRSVRLYEMIARVRPEHSVAAAEAEMNAFMAALAQIHPEHRGWGVEATVLADDLIRPFRGVIVLLLAAGTAFLLIAAVNVLGLVAARRIEGRHDRSIRLALGASEGRLLRGSLIECLVLATVGTVTGVTSAYWLMVPIRAIVPQDVPRLAEVAVTSPIAIVGLSIGLALGGVLGSIGYLVSRGANPSARQATTWRAVGVGGRRAIVIGQVALTTLLTAGSVAVLHRVSALRAMDLGYDPEGVSATSTVLVDKPSRYAPEARWAFARAVLEGLGARGIPAAMAVNTPMRGDDMPQIGMRVDAASEEIVYDLHLVSPNYFSVMGIELLAGRDFGPEDSATSQRVVIVSEEFVDQYFPERTPVESVVGRVLAPLMYETTGPLVVGVVRSTRHRSPAAPVEPGIYSPLSQLAVDAMTILVRGEPEQVAEAVTAVVAQVDPDDRWSPLVPYTSYLSEWFAPFTFQLLMIGVLAALGLLLASLGLYSLMAYQVAIDGKELGIRKALGARDGSLMLGVVARGVAMAVAGALIGLAAWYRLLPATRNLVDGIDSAGYLVPLAVAVVVGGSCVLATFVPALRATRVDLVATLKAD